MDKNDLPTTSQDYYYVPETLLPKILALMEESGISIFQAEMVPDFLRAEIKMCVDFSKRGHRFTVPKKKN